ncbi:MAG: hypothetical protein AB8G17_17425 [Gammaproteobacteria bacterium]
MKILLFSHLEQIREHAAYVRALKEVGEIDALLLTMGAQEYALADSEAVFNEVLDLLPAALDLDAAHTHRDETTATLGGFEKRLDARFVNRDLLMDRYFRGQPRLDVAADKVPLVWDGERARRFMALVGTSLQAQLERYDPDFVLVETSSAPSRMAWRLAHARGVPAGVFMPVRFWPNRLYLETGIGYHWHQARSTYAQLKVEPMANAEREEVQQRLHTLRQEKTKPAYLMTDHAKGLPGIVKKLNPKQRLEGLGLWLGERAKTYGRHPRVLPGPLFSPLAQLGRYVRARKSKRYLRDHHVPFSALRGKKYAVYFLHVQPELTVEEMAFDFQDQVNTLRNILAALPADMSLVVKEHSPMLGYRPLEVYSKLVHMPGIILVDTGVDSHELIAQSSVVVTLTGTVALEALLYRVPAVVLGSIYFDVFDGISKPENLDDMKSMLADPESLYRATEDDVLRMLGSLRRASSAGSPARLDVSVQSIDTDSAVSMLAELKSASKAGV